MLIGRHLGTPNSSFLLASLDATVCVIQYYSHQCALLSDHSDHSMFNWSDIPNSKMASAKAVK